jgi:hypothetical protein
MGRYAFLFKIKIPLNISLFSFTQSNICMCECLFWWDKKMHSIVLFLDDTITPQKTEKLKQLEVIAVYFCDYNRGLM